MSLCAGVFAAEFSTKGMGSGHLGEFGKFGWEKFRQTVFGTPCEVFSCSPDTAQDKSFVFSTCSSECGSGGKEGGGGGEDGEARQCTSGSVDISGAFSLLFAAKGAACCMTMSFTSIRIYHCDVHHETS